MDKQQIKHITGRHYQKLTKYINGAIPWLDAETIHQFRVEYKKLRAFLRMLSGTAEISVSRKLKKGYNILGSIRDLQLQWQRILEATKQEVKKPQAYFHLLLEEIEKLKPELADVFSENPIAESKKKTNACVPDEFPLSGFRNFVKQKWDGIYAVVQSGHFSDDHIHAVRKALKDLIYNLKIYEGVEHNILSLSIWKGKDEPYFNRLLEELGSFQDKCTAIALLKSYWLLRLNKYNREHLGGIKNIWIREKVNMKKLLVKKLKMEVVPKQKTLPVSP